MTDRPTPEQIKERQGQNRYAREVIAGNDVQLSHRASNAIPTSAPRTFQSARTLPSAGSAARTGYLLAIVAILLTSLVIYMLLDFESASVALFILSLVLMAGWFVFSRASTSTTQS